jgi:hypothetical protein
MDDSINFSLQDSKVKITERSKGRMRIDIKLSAEYAAGFKNFVKMFKPEEIDDGEFYRQLFFKGINKHIEDVQQFAKEQTANAAEQETEDPKKEVEDTDDETTA